MAVNKQELTRILEESKIRIKSLKSLSRPSCSFDPCANYMLVGIRGAGKSWLMYSQMQLFARKHGWDSILYCNFEDERLLQMDVSDLNTLLEIHMEQTKKQPICFFDEIQNVSGWEKFARRLADSKYRVYITGSNAKMLSHDIGTTLGARYLIMTVFPYCFSEYLSVNQFPLNPKSTYSTKDTVMMLNLLESYFHEGGFPESLELTDKRGYVSSVYQNIYLGDIAARNDIRNLIALKLMIKKIAESVGQPLSYTRITNVVSSAGVKIGKQTMINYVDAAKESFMIFPIFNWNGALSDRESTPKYYFIDNGLLNLLLTDPESKLLENIVAITLLHHYGSDHVYFYRNGIEVDFYLPEEEIAIQVSYDLSDEDTYAREVTALSKFSSNYPCMEQWIITRDQYTSKQKQDPSIKVIPLCQFLLSMDHSTSNH
jgi:predicted AAA+ superfamily ATPase